jgi:hypothetical protein
MAITGGVVPGEETAGSDGRLGCAFAAAASRAPLLVALACRAGFAGGTVRPALEGRVGVRVTDLTGASDAPEDAADDTTGVTTLACIAGAGDVDEGGADAEGGAGAAAADRSTDPSRIRSPAGAGSGDTLLSGAGSTMTRRSANPLVRSCQRKPNPASQCPGASNVSRNNSACTSSDRSSAYGSRRRSAVMHGFRRFARMRGDQRGRSPHSADTASDWAMGFARNDGSASVDR